MTNETNLLQVYPNISQILDSLTLFNSPMVLYINKNSIKINLELIEQIHFSNYHQLKLEGDFFKAYLIEQNIKEDSVFNLGTKVLSISSNLSDKELQFLKTRVIGFLPQKGFYYKQSVFCNPLYDFFSNLNFVPQKWLKIK